MRYGGDYDDAVDVIDVWLHEHPEGAAWERDPYVLPEDLSSEDSEGTAKVRPGYWDRSRN